MTMSNPSSISKNSNIATFDGPSQAPLPKLQQTATGISTGSLAVEQETPSPLIAAAAESSENGSSNISNNHLDTKHVAVTQEETSATNVSNNLAVPDTHRPLPPSSPISIASSTNSDDNKNNDSHKDEDEEDVDDVDDEEEDVDDNEDISREPSLKKNKKKARQKDEPQEQQPTKHSNVEHAPREDTSLGILARSFYQYMQSSKTGVVDLNDLARILRVPKRRIYDITNVLEGVGLIKRCSRNVIAWTGSLRSRRHDDEDEDDDDMDDDNDEDEEKQSSRTYNSDEDNNDDNGATSRWNASSLREEVQSYYHEEAILDTWISRLHRVLHTRTNLTCDASDIVKAFFHPIEAAKTPTSNSKSQEPITNQAKAQPSSNSRLINPSNLLDESGKVQWSLLAIHAPHGSLMQVSTTSTRNVESDCRLYISTKTELEPDDYDYDEEDLDGTLMPKSEVAEVLTKSALSDETMTAPTATEESTANDVQTNHNNEESNNGTLTNGETSQNGKHVRVNQNDDDTGNSNSHYRQQHTPKRQRRDDMVDIFLLPTEYNPKSSTVQLLASGAKSIPDPLPPVYATVPPVTATIANPATAANHLPTNGHITTNGHRNNLNNMSQTRKQQTLEDLQSWNFVAQLTHREGISDFFTQAQYQSYVTK